MGLVLSAVISYAGINDAIDCLKHLLSGVLPSTDPNFDDLVQYYTALLHKSQNAEQDWVTACGQGYLNLTEDADGHLHSAAVKYYHGHAPDSTAILFSTKISSFGDSIDDAPQSNGVSDRRNERYSPAKTKTIVTNTSNSFSINNRNKSPGADRNTPAESIDAEPAERTDDSDTQKDSEATDKKLTWNYTPLSPNPEIQFQSYEDDKPSFFSEEYLRSLDGIKYRPLQRSDPSNRRRNFRKRRSSSSTSSKDSRASRDEELQMFTSLEEAEQGEPIFGSSPNLSAPSHSRSRSRTPSERRSVEASDSADERAKEAKLGSFEEEVKEELIFSGEYTKAMNKDWHSGHFCCWQCDESLTGQRYVLRDEHPYCIKCYESVFANGCEECNKTIGIDSKDLSYKDKHWHEACFLCAKCRVSLVDKQFGSKLDKIYCGNCYDAQFASRCDGCGEVFRAGEY